MVTTRSSDPRGMRNNVNEDESVSTADNSKLLVEGNTKRKKNSKVTMTKNVKSPDALDELGGESLDAPDVTTGGDETMTKNDKIPTPPSTMTKTVKSRGFPSNEKVNLAKLPDALDVPVGNELPTKPILSSGASQLPAANSVHSVKTMHQSKEVPKGPILSPVASVEILETSQSPAANSVVFVKSTPGKETPNVEIVELPPWKRSNKPADLEAPPIFMTEMDQGGLNGPVQLTFILKSTEDREYDSFHILYEHMSSLTGLNGMNKTKFFPKIHTTTTNLFLLPATHHTPTVILWDQ
jgi:hypothetical protein